MPRPDPLKACEDFHRTVAHREVGLNRRNFIQLGMGAGLTLYAGSALPLTSALDSAQEAAAQAPDAAILVTVFLPGGVDLLDAFPPLDQYAAYRDARRGMAQEDAATPKLGDSGIGIHPSLTQGPTGGIKGLFEHGRIGLLPGIDYANPDLSHFHSRAFWETGIITSRPSTGWLGRWLDVAGSRRNPFQGLTSGDTLSPLLRSAGAPVCSIEGIASAEMKMAGLDGEHLDRAMVAWRELTRKRRGDSRHMAATRVAGRRAQDIAYRLRGIADQAPPPPADPELGIPGTPDPAGYPPYSSFAGRLRQLAFLLSQPLGVRVATVDADGDFDTHANQGPRLAADLAEISTSLMAFQRDIEQRGLGDRVLTLVWSEFGRRLRGNRSSGTDHGAGGIGWVQGTRVRSGLLSEYPSLERTDDKGNLKVTVDFRQVYASALEQWMATDANAVLPDAARLSRVRIVR